MDVHRRGQAYGWEVRARVMQALREKKSPYQIQRELRVSRSTVYKYIRQAEGSARATVSTSSLASQYAGMWSPDRAASHVRTPRTVGADRSNTNMCRYTHG